MCASRPFGSAWIAGTTSSKAVFRISFSFELVQQPFSLWRARTISSVTLAGCAIAAGANPRPMTPIPIRRNTRTDLCTSHYFIKES